MTVWIFDFASPSDGIKITSEVALLRRLETVREGMFGNFILATSRDRAVSRELCIQINGQYAYVHFFDDLSGANPSYQAFEMLVADCPDEVRFIQIGESEHSTGNTMPKYTLCSVGDAYQAALEFFEHPESMPRNINWNPLWIEK